MRSYRVFLFGAVFAFACSISNAQQTGEITGTVADSSGAVIPEATITARSVATQQSRSTTSNSSGNYVIPYLVPGNYQLVVQKDGFKRDVRQDVVITIGSVIRVDVKLQVGQVTEQVEVSTATPLLTTESAAVQTDIGNHQIVSLPLNGRDYLQLVALTPNVVAEAAASSATNLQGGVRSKSALSVAGQRLEFNHYTLDGVENTDPNFNSYIIHPSVDALQEFTVMTGVYSAEYGRGAGQINANTLPGSNSYHGVAYDFMRNDYVDAKIWRQPGDKSPFHRQNYGFVLDGPISIPRVFDGKNHLFFASSYEALRDHELDLQVGSVPTLAMRNGDFSQFGVGTGKGQIPQIYVPSSRNFTTKTATPLSYNGANNVMNPTLITSQAKALLAYLPLPTGCTASSSPNCNGGVTGTIASNYKSNQPAITDSTQFNQRIDYTQNTKSSWFGRYSWQHDYFQPVSLFGPATADNTTTTVRQAVLGNTLILNPHVVNDARFAWDQFENTNAGYYTNGTVDIQSTLGIAGLTAQGPENYGLPGVSFGSSGLSGFGGAVPYITHDHLFQWSDGVSVIKGNHAIRVGGMYERDRYNQFGNQFAVGTFGFNGFSTQSPAAPTTTGYGLADMLFGYVSNNYFRVTSLSNVQLRRSVYATFIQDDWKVTRWLTLNLGLRYDNTRPWFDKNNAMMNAQVFTTGVNTPAADPGTEPLSTVIPGSQSPILTRPGPAGCDFYAGMGFRYSQPGQPVQCGDQYMGRSTQRPNNKNFGPRIGLNIAIGNKWSIRTGFGIFYTSDTGNYVFDMGRNLGGKDGLASVPATSLVPLAAPWGNGAANPACAPWTGLCVSAPQIQAAGYNNRTPYVEQYMFNVQRQLSRNVAIEVAYMGNQSHHLNRYFIVNQAVPKTGASDNSTAASRRPWPAMGPVQVMSDWDRGVYNAANVKLSQHISHGLLYSVAFTWSRSIDFGSAIRGNTGDNLWPTNTYNLAQERGPSQFNQPKRLVGSFVYLLPVGKDKAWVPSNGIVNHVLSGWSIGGILTIADGTSMNASTLSDTSGLGTLSNVPFYTGQPFYASERTPEAYYNKAGFDYTNPALTYRTGNMRRTVLYTPGYKNFDTNIARTFHIWESHVIEFRFEAFNTFNHPNWNPPVSSNTTNASFGVINTARTMRQLQAALKYSF